MSAGELRHRIKLQSKMVARNGFNEELATWSTVATVWAKVEAVSGSEQIAQQQQTALLTHKVTLRYRTDVTPAMIVLWGSRRLEIHSVQPENVPKQMVLMCSEKQ